MGCGGHGLGCILDLLCRNAGIDARFEDLVAEHNRTRGYDGIIRNDGAIHQYRAHSHKYVAADFGAMYHRIVPHRYVIADFYDRTLIERVEHCTVLDIHPVSDYNGVYIPAQYGTIPYTAIITDGDITYQCGVLRQKAPLPDYGSLAVKFFDYCHPSESSWIISASRSIFTKTSALRL